MNLITRSRDLALAMGWILLLLAVPAHALSPVWMVEKDGRLMFVGGTLHVLTAENYPLPKAFETAYSRSGLVVFETDLGKMEDPAGRRDVGTPG